MSPRSAAGAALVLPLLAAAPARGGAAEAPLVTFVVPSTGRASLAAALESLQAQGLPTWRAVVVLDGHAPPGADAVVDAAGPPAYLRVPRHVAADRRVAWALSPLKRGRGVNWAGDLRNAGIARAATEWVAFLDDDDTVDAGYVAALHDEARRDPAAAAVVFRMHCTTCFAPVLPRAQDADFMLNHVGISFAVRRADPLAVFGAGAAAAQGCAEDYLLLHGLRKGLRRVVISPRVTYHVGGARPPPAAAARPLPRRVVQWTAADAASGRGDLPATICDWQRAGAAAPARPGPRFAFPDAGSRFFAGNARGLARSLERARAAGCLDGWRGADEVEVRFGFDAPPGDRPYVQYQVEQAQYWLHNESYTSALRGAAAVWDFSQRNIGVIAAALPDVAARAAHVPLWHAADDAHPAPCADAAAAPCAAAVVTRVRADGAAERCAVRPRRGCGAAAPAGVPECPAHRALFYGKLSPERVAACVNASRGLRALGYGADAVGCYEGLFDAALSAKVCEADAVFVGHYYPDASLETHRIDALLLGAVPVAAAAAAQDPAAAEYAAGGHVRVVAPGSGFAPALHALLRDPAAARAAAREGQAWLAARRADLRPLCHARRQLPAAAAAAAARRPRGLAGVPSTPAPTATLAPGATPAPTGTPAPGATPGPYGTPQPTGTQYPETLYPGTGYPETGYPETGYPGTPLPGSPIPGTPYPSLWWGASPVPGSPAPTGWGDAAPEDGASGAPAEAPVDDLAAEGSSAPPPPRPAPTPRPTPAPVSQPGPTPGPDDATPVSVAAAEALLAAAVGGPIAGLPDDVRITATPRVAAGPAGRGGIAVEVTLNVDISRAEAGGFRAAFRGAMAGVMRVRRWQIPDEFLSFAPASVVASFWVCGSRDECDAAAAAPAATGPPNAAKPLRAPGRRLSDGAVAGAAIGAIAGFVLLTLGGALLWRRARGARAAALSVFTQLAARRDPGAGASPQPSDAEASQPGSDMNTARSHSLDAEAPASFSAKRARRVPGATKVLAPPAAALPSPPSSPHPAPPPQPANGGNGPQLAVRSPLDPPGRSF